MSALSTNVTRRRLLKNSGIAAGAALVIGFDVPRVKAAPDNPVVNPLKAWIRIDQNGVVTLLYSKSEMGQGVSTSLPMILADEMGADWKNVRVEHAPVEKQFGSQGTGGGGSKTTLLAPLPPPRAAAP